MEKLCWCDNFTHLIRFVFELVFSTFRWLGLKINIGLLTPIEGIKHDIHTYICADDVHANGLTWCFSEEMKTKYARL